MACYAAVAPLLDLLDDVLCHNRYPNFLLVHSQQQILGSLHKKFRFLLEFLMGHSSEGNKAAVDVMGRRIRDAAYRAQDFIESEIWEQMDFESREKHDIVDKTFHQQISACQNDLPRSKVCCDEDLRKVEQEVDSIVKEVKAIVESQSSTRNCSRDAGRALLRAPYGEINMMVGCQDQVNRMRDHLTYSSHHLQVISIVGMAGIGKTHLARHLFNDPFIVNYFDCRSWANVSQDYEVNGVLQSIFTSLGFRDADKLRRYDTNELIHQTFKCLCGRRYLIVMDDVRSVDFWEEVRRALPDNVNGSRIILTTRLSSLDLNAGNTLNEMRFLDVDESWVLFRHKVFGQEPCPLELVDIGKIIASKCGGLPLAIIVIANLLANTHRTRHHWEIISSNFDSILSGDENMTNIFFPSYDSLPHHLKACFLYMGIFPEDYEISISQLFKLWIAEGFFKSIGSSKTREEVAEECLMDLISRNLVLVNKRRANGDIKNCIMHNVLRSFCRKLALDEDFFHAEQQNGHLHQSYAIENARRITLHQTLPHEPQSYNVGKFVRSVLWFGNTSTSNFDTIEWDNLKLLRILRMFLTTSPIPNAIFQMFHLKYLEFYLECHIQGISLPSSISRLENLQTLIVSSPFTYTITLPPEIWRMMQLRHIIIGAIVLPHIPIVSGIPIKKLEYLQTLTTVENFIFTNEAIEVIPNLRKLKICCARNEEIDIWELYCLENLVQLHQLQELKINIVDSSPFSYNDSVWGSMVLPRSLRELTLQGSKFSWDEMEVVGWLPNLQVLRLKKDSFVGEEWETVEGEFGQLKFLLMEELDLMCWQVEDYHFPCLRRLKISMCSELQEIPMEIGEIPTLEVIDVYKSESAGVSAKRIQEEQQDYGKDDLKVYVKD